MPRSPSVPPNSGIGYYVDSPLPVDPVVAGIRNLFGALKGPPGIRLAQTNDPSGRYYGTNLIPPSYSPATIPAAVNTPDDLNQAVISSETYGPGVPL